MLGAPVAHLRSGAPVAHLRSGAPVAHLRSRPPTFPVMRRTRLVPPGLLHPLQVEWDADLRGGDPLGWPGYGDALAGLPRGDSVITGRAAVHGMRPGGRYAVLAGRFECMGGSMGAVHGERVVRAFRRAAIERLPVVILASSGGARLQEGMVALVQMARTAAAARLFGRAGGLIVAVLRPPTTGGVWASYASLADVRAGEPGATIGLAGPRVVELVTGRPLPEHSHRSEMAYAAGLLDALVPRDQQASWVEAVLGLRDLPLEAPPRDAVADGDAVAVADGGAVAVAEARAVGGGDAAGGVVANAWQAVLSARARGRPSGIDHAAHLCQSWIELRGGDPTLRAGLARIRRRRVVVIASNRHAGGSTGPAAFQLARRAIALADRLGLPLVTLVDTPGADVSTEAESAGVSLEIARTFAAMSELRTPSVSVCVGEGGSGGALALAFADRFLMCRGAVFSVLSPEGVAAVLARDVSAAPRLASQLKLTAQDVAGLGLADGIVDDAPEAVATAVEGALGAARAGDRARRFDRATVRWLR